MKKRTLVLLAMLPCMYGLAQNSKGYTITGHLKGNGEGKKVYLRPASDPKGGDSTVIKNGTFEFRGKVDYPQMYEISITRDEFKPGDKRPPFQPLVPLFLENTNITLTAELDSIRTQLDMLTDRYDYSKVSIKGAPLYDQYLAFNKEFAALQKKSSDAFMDYIAYLNPGKGKEKGPVSVGIAAVDKVDAAKKNILDYLTNYLKKNSSSYVAAYVFKKNMGTFSVDEMKAAYEGFSPTIKNSPVGANLKETMDKTSKTAVGANYVDFAFNDKDGNPVKLSDHVGKGKYVLLEFWASWCGPCRADIPHLKEVYDLYHPAGFEVISVSMDDDKAKWEKAMDEEKMKWLQVSDLKAFNGELTKIYNFNAIPTCVLIGPDGKIVTRNMRGSWMDKRLIAMYGNKFGSKY